MIENGLDVAFTSTTVNGIFAAIATTMAMR